jgi:hypothetical protein
VRAIKLTVATVALLFATAIAWAPASSIAATKVVPPGLSGANQYSETVPGAGGNNRAGEIENPGGKPPSTEQALGTKNARALEDLGPEGRRAAELAARTTPRKHRRHGHTQAGGAGSGGSGSSGGDSGLDQVLGQITGTGGSDAGGMDWLLPFLIGASVLTAGAYLVAKRRSAGPQD